MLGVGAGVLSGIRGWRSWTELLRLSGLVYLLGVAALGVALTLELVVGLDVSFATVLVTGLVLAVAGLAVGRARGFPWPSLRPYESSRHRLALPAAALVALVVVYFQALFRSGRLAGVYEFDAWFFWLPKAKAIYFFGELDPELLRQIPAQTYPPIVPALQASAFQFMGSADAVTVHLLFWFPLVAFVAAVWGLLTPRVSPLLLWPLTLLVLVSPLLVGHALQPQADLLLDELFATAALLVGLWLLERRPWQLAAASLLLGGTMLTKREGYLLAACIVIAALAASWRERRAAWPRLLLVGAVAFVLALPWRIWFGVNGLEGEEPPGGWTWAFGHLDRAWPSLKLTVSTLFDYDLWLVVAPLAVVAIALALVAGARRLPAYAALLFALGSAGFTWSTWAFDFAITKDNAANPIGRLTGSLILVSAALVPLLLDAAWRGSDRPREAS